MKKKLNLTGILLIAAFVVFLVLAGRGMPPRDLLITTLRGFSVGSVTFLVAAGFSLIFGLLDVLNLAQGTLYMIGAYVGWTVFVRPDTFVDVTPIILFLMAGFALNFLWDYLADKIKLDPQKKKILGWSMVVVAVALTAFILPRYPIAMWQLNNYAQSPISFSYMADQGIRLPVAPAQAKGIPPMLALYGGLAISALLAFGLALIRYKENR